MSKQRTLPGFQPATGSLASAVGPSRCGSLAGPTIGPSGPGAPPVSRTVRRGSGSGSRTSGTCGPPCSGSLRSAGRPSSSGSKSHPQKLSALSVRLLSLSRFAGAISPEPTRSPSSSLRPGAFRINVDGSIEYSLTWKESVTPAGRTICRLRASGRSTCGSGCSGWHTPKATDGTKGGPNQTGETLVQDAMLSGWGTPNTRDHKAEIDPEAWKREGQGQPLSRQVRGTTTPSSTAGTTGAAASPCLNPAFSRWLMGFPATWDTCSPGWKEWAKVQRMLGEYSPLPGETESGD